MKTKSIYSFEEYVTNINKSIYRLIGHPFYLNDEQLEITLLLVKNVQKSFFNNIPLAMKDENIHEDDAALKLLNGKIEYPEFGIACQLPSIFDMGASVNDWIMYIDDSNSDLKFVKDNFKEKHIGVLTVNNPGDFLNILKKRPFFQYWVDLGLGTHGDVEVGEKLITQMQSTKMIQELNGETIVYTHNLGRSKIDDMINNKIVKEEIDKSDSKDVENQIITISNDLLVKLKQHCGANPTNPLIDLVAV